ncbi:MULTISPECIES: sugar phosphate isomerase/epimerase family protein [Pseudonocardia]|uniref:Inosose dehydratase n=2 Tax=Pseudonocardia TaxID=1847 RepID=A0A1Y2MT56_PSEAH|nr:MULTISPECIES: sugar phosphate isomerase/epimerase [Pseudonocardia]OSY38383.1 Inosose dehydratase [Pseudonocardia autotrophica]TDN72573.1 inosose dehydratase [Pseudonocardia autotrophica]BBG03281.1 inosose dehydratase [Pseudonocardia autotrophica]GEC24539.1 inosose dehydratase [Pseudonocardia saturnea]
MPAPRIAGAPISWGVCEVPGWGFQLDPDRVLTEMREVGLVATEFGPEGFLPDAPDAKAATLQRYGLHAVGGFTPTLLHVPEHDPLAGVDELLAGYDAAGAGTLVLSADSGGTGYDSRPELDEGGWKLLLSNLDRIADHAATRGVTAVLHPHVGTMVETGDDVRRVLEGARIQLCLDTGHLLIGGTDPAELARQAPERISHTHLKDVDLGLARQVQDGRRSYTEAVGLGMYRPLGEGDLDLDGVLSRLDAYGYTGWHVLEQDTILHGPPSGAGPVEDVSTSVQNLRAALPTG